MKKADKTLSKKGHPIKEKLEKIRHKRAYEQLVDYSDPVSWEPMSGEERELLGLLFVERGEVELKANRPVIKSFDLAAKVAPLSYEVFYRQGLAFAAKENRIWFLKAALRRFAKAATLSPNRFEPWYAWGSVLCKLGIIKKSVSLLQQAEEKFCRAEAELGSTGKAASLYHLLGVVWYHLGQLSGEAHEMVRAAHYFQRARVRGAASASFWSDCGHVFSSLALLLNRFDYLIFATNSYWKAIHLNPKEVEGWRGAALNFSQLYFSKGYEDDFIFAHHSFEEVIALDPQDFSSWVKWGLLLVRAGSRKRDPLLIKEGIAKYQAANLCLSNDHSLLAFWVEALVILGTLIDALQPLKEAEQRIAICLEAEPRNASFLALAGRCELELARYFGERRRLFAAQEYFADAVHADPNCAVGWYGRALSYFLIGEETGEPELLQQALIFYEQAELHGMQSVSFLCDWGFALAKTADEMRSIEFAQEALETFEKALVVASVTHEPIDLELLCHYGYVCDLLIDLSGEVEFGERAVHFFEKAIEVDPSCTAAHFGIAMALIRLGEALGDLECYQRGFLHFRFCAESDPECAECWLEWGGALISCGRLAEGCAANEQSQSCYTEAEKKLQRAVALGEEGAHYLLAGLYSLTGSFDLSMDHLLRTEEAGLLPGQEQLCSDDWFQPLLEWPPFQNWLSRDGNG